jgi:hypothetical protein
MQLDDNAASHVRQTENAVVQVRRVDEENSAGDGT